MRSVNEDKFKLPRLYPAKISLNGGGAGLANQLTPTSPERKRFITVVRPLSVFPDPLPPPNYSAFNAIQENLSDFSQNGAAAGGKQRNVRQAANFSIAGQSVVNGNAVQRDNNVALKSALKVNLAGGSGWDLTAMKRNQKPMAPFKPR